MGGVASPSSSAKPPLPPALAGLGFGGLSSCWAEFLKSSQSLFNKSQNQWIAMAHYRILSEKCVLLLAARRHRAHDVSLSSTLDFVLEKTVSLPSVLRGIKLWVLLWPIGNAFVYRSRRAQAFSKKYSFGLESKPNSEGIAHNSWGLFMYGPEQKNSAFGNRVSQHDLKY